MSEEKMRYIVIVIWENGNGKDVCDIVRDSESDMDIPKYFRSFAEASEFVEKFHMRPAANFMVINIQTLESVSL